MSIITLNEPNEASFTKAWNEWKGGPVAFHLKYALAKFTHIMSFQKMPVNHDSYREGAAWAWKEHTKEKAKKNIP